MNNFIKKAGSIADLMSTEEYKEVKETVHAFYKIPIYMSPKQENH